jgi:Holliday junction resolvase-like predicted endonuclease
MYNKKIEQNMEILGRMGEKYVAKWLRDQGHTVDESLFHFDSQKDMTCDDVTVEVKTHVPFVKAQAFGIKTQQLRKCRILG